MANRNFFSVNSPEGGMDRNLAPGIDATIFVGEQAMVSVVRLKPGSKGKIHNHLEEQWGFCQSGRGIRIQDGKRIAVGAGDFWLTPGGIDHGIEAGDDGMLVIDVFAPPRGSYKTAGSGFAVTDK